MIAYPEMLTPMADKAGMKIPKNPREFDVEKYPHFHVYISVQLGRPILGSTSHWTNAEIIAKIPKKKIKKVTLAELVKMGFE